DDVLRVSHGPTGFRCYPGTGEIRLRPGAAALAAAFHAAEETVDGRIALRPDHTGPTLPRLDAIVIPYPSRTAPALPVERLPPLANLFAAHDPDPLRLADLAAELEASGEFVAVWRPAPGWVAAAAPLPGGPADQFEGRDSALAVAEGREGDRDAGFIRFDPDG